MAHSAEVLYLPVEVESLQQLYPALSGGHTVRRVRLLRLRAHRHTCKHQQGSDGKPAPEPRMHTHSKHLLQKQRETHRAEVRGSRVEHHTTVTHLDTQHYFFLPGLVCDIRLLVVESCSRHMSRSLRQELRLSAGKQLVVVPHIHLLPWKTLQGRDR